MPPDQSVALKRAVSDDADLRYMRSLAAAVVQRSPRYLSLVLLVMGLAVATAIAWMSYAKVDVVVRGSGKVIPSQQLQVIQSLEGGVVTEILVNEGSLVELGQPVIKISDVAFSSSAGENRLHYLGLRATMARLEAEAHGTPFEPDPAITAEAPELVRAARSLYESRQAQVAETLQILEEQVRQHESSLAEARAKRRQIETSLSLTREELALKEPLVSRGLVSRVEFLQLRKQENDQAGELEGLRLSIPRFQSLIDEAKGKIQESMLEFRNSAKRELNETAAESSRIAETQAALKDRVQRTTIRSPVKGTVTRLHINTVGGVVGPGAPIMEIVPFEDALLVQVNIKPQDIANISAGQPARLKFSAYDFAIHGSLEGEVVFLSADTVTNEDGESFYVTRIKPERAYLGHTARPLHVRVGMTVEADIITDKKSILDYLLKPINRGLQRALREG